MVAITLFLYAPYDLNTLDNIWIMKLSIFYDRPLDFFSQFYREFGSDMLFLLFLFHELQESIFNSVAARSKL